MLSGSGNELADAVLRKLAVHYMMDGIEEVAVNRPGYVYRKMRGGVWVEYPDPEITYQYIKQICLVLANINGAKFSEQDLPIVSCELPGAPFRFQAIVGNNVRYDLGDRRGSALAIRSLQANTQIRFENYGLTPGVKLAGAMQDWFGAELRNEEIDRLQQVIDTYQSVLVSGATSTGKTTFINQIINLIDRGKRIITVEDAREVTVPHQNRIHLMVPRNRGANSIGYNEILDVIVRMTPDFLVCGELSVNNAQPLFSLMQKGHPVLATVHAASPAQAMRAFVNNMASKGTGSGMTGESTMDTLESMVGCIVQLVYRDGKRQVTEIVFPSREHHERHVRSAARLQASKRVFDENERHDRDGTPGQDV